MLPFDGVEQPARVVTQRYEGGGMAPTAARPWSQPSRPTSSHAARPKGADAGAEGAGLGNTRTASGDVGLRQRQRELRAQRFRRQKRSSGLLVARARDDFALDHWMAMTDLGAPVSDDFVTISPTGEIRGNGDALGGIFVRPPRPARCGWALASQVGVHSDEAGKGHFGVNEAGERAVEHCASISSCPSCAAVIRGRRALDIGRAVEVWHQREEGQALFLTLTLRHQKSHTLQDTLDVLMTSWKKLQTRQLWAGSGKRAKQPVAGLRESLAMEGWIRSLEVTYTDGTGAHRTGHGWHPHLHLLLFVRNIPMSVKTLRETLAREWQSVVQGHSPKHTPSLDRGVDLQVVQGDGSVLATYLAKLQGESTIGAEMARHDWKSGAARGSWNPFEFLDDTGDDSLDHRNGALWLEYTATMHGRRIIEWSRGLQAILLPEEEELTDEEVIADTEAKDWHLDLPRKTYRSLRSDPILTAFYLDAVGYGEWDTAEALLRSGAPPTVKFD